MTARSLAQHAIDTAIAAADPSRVVDAALTRPPFTEPFDLLCTGKAGATCAAAALHRVQPERTLVIAPEPTLQRLQPSERLIALPGDHPQPTDRSKDAALAVEAFITDAERPLLMLLSGGGSAMIARPIAPLSLDDLRAISDHLMRAGADIHDLNAVRAHIDHTKAGRLGALTSRPMHVLVLSDVIGDRLESVSSGPFFGTPRTADDAIAILQRTDAPDTDRLAEAIDGSPHPPLAPTDPRLAHITHEVVASNRTVADAVTSALDAAGCTPRTEYSVIGEARDIADDLAAQLRQHRGAIVFAGEPTVSNISPGSLGGPMQEAVAAAALALHRATDAPEDWAVAGYATDGVDGPTPAAGALITRADLANQPGLADLLTRALSSHDTHRALADAALTIPGGPTGTNLNDLLVAIGL